nr:Gfo/Idh/MocA family oxidoreductase [Paenibacillus sp. Soil750]
MRTHFLDPNQRVYDKYRDHYYDTPSWYFDDETAKGPIFSHGSHDYDLLMWMCGEIESVFAYGGTYLLPPGSVADAFTVSLRFANGGIGQVSTHG